MGDSVHSRVLAKFAGDCQCVGGSLNAI